MGTKLLSARLVCRFHADKQSVGALHRYNELAVFCATRVSVLRRQARCWRLDGISELLSLRDSCVGRSQASTMLAARYNR